MAFRNEAFSFFTHAAGALVGIVGLVALLLRSRDAVEVAAFSVYGATLVLMFVTSALHHVAHSEDGFFRRLDMTAIYLFIAGTYTPFCLLAVPPLWGWPMLGVVWTLALVGIGLRWTRPATPRWVTAGLYLGLGWLSVAGVYPLWKALGIEAIVLLALGGVVYSVGAIVYARKRPDPWPAVVGHHGLWHLFVLGGAGLHFALVWRLLA